MKKFALSLAAFVILFNAQAKQDSTIEKRIYDVYKLENLSPVIDGILDDEAWKNATWQDQFTQHFPYSGAKASHDTRFAIAHDANYIYVAFHAIDYQTDSIVSRVTRRDDVDGDYVFIDFDSYHDLQTCFAFIVSAGGSKGDLIISNDGNSEDDTWDPVWWVKTSIVKDGWVAEMKIPFSQLRFDNSASGIWGLNVGRHIFRVDEMTLWQHVDREASGFIHHFGKLDGLKGVKPRKQAEVVPYLTSGIEKYEAEEGNPFRTGTSSILNAGIDAKLGVTNNLTLDLSVNPDFGQVEADPSEVNLSAYESYFSEKRPLFIEGKSIYNFPLRFGNNSHGESLFYSRRIGRKPHYYPETTEGEYVKMPHQTSILAAAKLSGKTNKGTSIGILESIAMEEFATIDNNGERRKESVEPLTNYFVSRIVQDINEGNTIIGGILTSTNRKINQEHLEFIPHSAVSGGLDFTQFFKDKSYYFKATAYASQVNGTEEAITKLQESSARTFNRPGADYLNYDTTLTRLKGHGGNLQFWKISGRLHAFTALVWKSPGLELNDVGFLRSSDEVFQLTWAGYNWYEPFSIFRRLQVNADYYTGWDFGGNKQFSGTEIGANGSFKNLWSFHVGLDYAGKKQFNGYLRGGPSIKLPGENSFRISIETNETKKFVAAPFFMFSKTHGSTSNLASYSLELSYRPTDKLSIEALPEYVNSINELQYVTSLDYDGTQYIMGTLHQKLLMMSLRLNLSLTPDLSIQYWGQPFVINGQYNDYKFITNSLADNYSDRFELYTEEQLFFDNGTIGFSEAGMEAEIDYSFSDPNFNVKEFLSNLVIRWEYRPGSVVFLVWSQNRSEFDNVGDIRFRQHLPEIWKGDPTNIFLLKFSYRLGR